MRTSHFDDVVLTRPYDDINDVIVTIIATGEAVTLVNLTDGNNTGVDYIDFADGTSIFASKAEIGPIATIVGTDGDDVINGSNSIYDVIDCGLGDDVINGGDWDDTYIWRMGDGNDRIIDPEWAGGSDRVIFEDVNFDDVVFTRSYNRINDMIVTVIATGEMVTLVNIAKPLNEGVDYIDFADGTSIYASLSEIERIATVIGEDSQYTYAVGDGDVTITDENGVSFDVLTIDPTVMPDAVAVRGQGQDLVIDIQQTGSAITVKNNFDESDHYNVDRIEFGDGTIWTDADIRLMAIAPNDGDQHLIGYNTDDVMVGGLGNDRLDGGLGDDTYLFSAGDGQDEIFDVGGTDSLVFGAGITADTLFLSRTDIDNRDLTIDLAGGDRVTVHSQFIGDSFVEQIEFADGTVWDMSAFRIGTAGADTLVGDDGDNVFIGSGAGADTWTGGLGRDTFVMQTASEAGDTITDFETGANGDLIDVKRLLSEAGYDGTDPFLDGYLRKTQEADDTLVEFDADGGGDAFATLFVLTGIQVGDIHEDQLLA